MPAEADHIAEAFMMQNLKGSSCTVLRARQCGSPLTSFHMRLMHPSFATRFLNQRPKILHFSGRAVGGAGVLSGSDAVAVDAGIQLADGVLAARDFAALDLSRCIVVVLSCSWVSVEDVCGLPELVSGLMAAGAWAVVASTSNIPALARKDFLETL
jgi:hypothetical protein